MALKKRDSFLIGGVGNYMEKACTELSTAKDKLLRDIENMKQNYQGVDADAITARLEEATNRLEPLIQRFDYYSKYMKGVSSHDKENIEAANKQINSMIQNSPMQNQNIVQNVPIPEEELETLDLSSFQDEVLSDGSSSNII